MSKISNLSVYDIQTKSFILDSVDRSVVMDKFGINTHTVSQYIYKGYKLENRYIICRQEDMGKVEDTNYEKSTECKEDLPKKDGLLDQWNDTMEAIKALQNGGHFIYKDGKPHHVEAVK